MGVTRAPTKKLKGVTVLANESGNRFYHRHMSPKARAKKKVKRKAPKKARRG